MTTVLPSTGNLTKAETPDVKISRRCCQITAGQLPYIQLVAEVWQWDNGEAAEGNYSPALV